MMMLYPGNDNDDKYTTDDDVNHKQNNNDDIINDGDDNHQDNDKPDGQANSVIATVVVARPMKTSPVMKRSLARLWIGGGCNSWI